MQQYVRETVDCNNCPLSSVNRVWGRGSEQGNIIFLGEAPGQEEDQNREPFVGKAGRLLRKTLKDEVGILPSNNWLTNTINCKPPRNNFDDKRTKVARKKHCNEGIYEELEFLKNSGYTVLVPLGNNALSIFDNIPQKITKVHGNVYRELGFMVIPTYHPSYILRNGGNGSNMWNIWVKDFIKIKEELLLEVV